MSELQQIEFFQLRKVREKKFSKRLKRIYATALMSKEQFEEKVKRIRLIACKVDGKIK